MASTIRVDIVSAEGEIYSGDAAMVFAPASQGDLGIAPRHAPLITTMRPGEVRVQLEEGEELFFFVTGGALEIQPYQVTVLADTAMRAKDLDEAAAIDAKRRAEEAMDNQEADFDMAAAQSELAVISAQLKAIQKVRKQAKR